MINRLPIGLQILCLLADIGITLGLASQTLMVIFQGQIQQFYWVMLFAVYGLTMDAWLVEPLYEIPPGWDRSRPLWRRVLFWSATGVAVLFILLWVVYLLLPPA